MTGEESFETTLSPELASDEAALIVDVEGFEGPLDLLLMLARQQKVDLSRISILALADQYLAFIEEARDALERLFGMSQDWSRLDQYLINYVVEPSMRATVMASSFAAVLEMVREGAVEMHQHQAFAPIFLRKRADGGAQPPTV